LTVGTNSREIDLLLRDPESVDPLVVPAKQSFGQFVSVLATAASQASHVVVGRNVSVETGFAVARGQSADRALLRKQQQRPVDRRETDSRKLLSNDHEQIRSCGVGLQLTNLGQDQLALECIPDDWQMDLVANDLY